MSPSAVLFLFALSGASALSCSNLTDWSHVIYDYIRLPESDYRLRMEEWSHFCNALEGRNALKPGDIRDAWAAYSPFPPLTACTYNSTVSRPGAVGESMSNAQFLVGLTQLAVLVAALILYSLRRRQSYAVGEPTYVRNSSNHINCGAELQR